MAKARQHQQRKPPEEADKTTFTPENAFNPKGPLTYAQWVDQVDSPRHRMSMGLPPVALERDPRDTAEARQKRIAESNERLQRSGLLPPS